METPYATYLCEADCPSKICLEQLPGALPQQLEFRHLRFHKGQIYKWLLACARNPLPHHSAACIGEAMREYT